jgi:7,8-dihydropterin-6-yl-methyl-4-(beta-D-ribofuranosyl)aminobenzene 5'-phosphate synthase
MKLIMLMENRGSANRSLINEFGFSAYVECDDLNILFDFGPNLDTLKNVQALNIHLEEVDYLIGSHGHFDHSGGYPAFLRAGCHKPFITGEGYFNEKYSLDGIRATYLGNSFDENLLRREGIEHKVCKKVLKLSETEFIMGGFKRVYDFETIPDRFCIRNGKALVKDNFDDEICFVHKMKDGLFVLVGCSHPGILNILSSVKEYFGMPIIGVVGGTHLKDASEDRMRRTIQVIKSFGISFIGFNHCTGEKFENLIREETSIKAVHLGTGDALFI